MKVAFLSFYSGEVYRGVETYVHSLANELVNLGHEVTVFQCGRQIDGSKYKVEIISQGTISRFSIEALKRLDVSTDIVIPMNNGWQSVLTKMWSQKHHCKVVISGQSGIGFSERTSLYTFPDCFIALSEHQLKISKQRNPFIKYAKIPNGVDIDAFQKAKPAKLDLPRPIVMTASALVPMKRVDLIIKAVAKTHASLLIVGSGSEENNLKRLCDRHLTKRYKIMSVPHDKIASLYKSANLFAFATSPWESFGIVLVEAMATGLAIVSSNDPIRREIIGEAGVFVDPTNNDAFANAIGDALKKKWGAAPIEQAKKFSWKKIASQYDDLFTSLIK